MTTEEDRTAASEHLSNRLIDLARAEWWVGELRSQQAALNAALDGLIKPFGADCDGAPIESAAAQLRERAVQDYMNGVSEDDDDDGYEAACETAILDRLDAIRTKAVWIIGAADTASYLIAPPVWAPDDPWKAEKSPEALRPEAGEPK